MTHELSDHDRETLDGRCGYAIVDRDGIEEPCDRPATGWRWYQDVDHEDALDVACAIHENEGGRRMASLIAERDAAAVARDNAQAEADRQKRRADRFRAFVSSQAITARALGATDWERRMLDTLHRDDRSVAALDGSGVTE